MMIFTSTTDHFLTTKKVYCSSELTENKWETKNLYFEAFVPFVQLKFTFAKDKNSLHLTIQLSHFVGIIISSNLYKFLVSLVSVDLSASEE